MINWEKEANTEELEEFLLKMLDVTRRVGVLNVMEL